MGFSVSVQKAMNKTGSSEASNDDLGVIISDDQLFDSCAEDLDNEDEGTNESLTALEILNRYCLKVKEEAMVITRSMKLIRQVTICLMRATANQCQRQVNGVLQSYGVDPSRMPKLAGAFKPAHWIHDSPELNDELNLSFSQDETSCLSARGLSDTTTPNL